MQLTALAAVLPLLSILAQPTTATFKAGTANNADVDARSISADIQPADNGVAFYPQADGKGTPVKFSASDSSGKSFKLNGANVKSVKLGANIKQCGLSTGAPQSFNDPNIKSSARYCPFPKDFVNKNHLFVDGTKMYNCIECY